MRLPLPQVRRPGAPHVSFAPSRAESSLEGRRLFQRLGRRDWAMALYRLPSQGAVGFGRFFGSAAHLRRRKYDCTLASNVNWNRHVEHSGPRPLAAAPKAARIGRYDATSTFWGRVQCSMVQRSDRSQTDFAIAGLEPGPPVTQQVGVFRELPLARH